MKFPYAFSSTILACRKTSSSNSLFWPIRDNEFHCLRRESLIQVMVVKYFIYSLNLYERNSLLMFIQSSFILPIYRASLRATVRYIVEFILNQTKIYVISNAKEQIKLLIHFFTNNVSLRIFYDFLQTFSKIFPHLNIIQVSQFLKIPNTYNSLRNSQMY